MERIMKFSHNLSYRKRDSRLNCLFLRAAEEIITGKNTGTDRLKSLRYAQVNWSFLLMTGDGILRRIIL